MRRRIVTALLVALVVFALLVPAVFINSVYGYLPALFALAALGISLISLRILRRRVAADSDFVDGVCDRGGKVSAGLFIVNGSRLMSARAAANIYISDLFGGQDSKSEMYFTMAPRDKTRFGLNMSMPHVGVYHAGVDGVELWDFFGFFRSRVPVKGEFEVFVRPRVVSLEELWETETVMAESNVDARTVVPGGMDYVGVREYEMGDSMKQIHWKLSAHSRGYMTKLQESAREMEFAVVADMCAATQKDREVLMDVQDAVIETALSAIESISQQHTNYSLLYLGRGKTVRRVHPRGRETDLEIVKDLHVITPDPGPEFTDAAAILQDSASVAARATNVIVATSRVTAELIQELIRVKSSRRVPTLLYIVPAGLTSREMDARRAPLRQLDDAGISWAVIRTTDAGGAS